jgi:large subunit ribosomal protein L13
MKTHVTKPAEISREWYVVDADGVVLGRLASEVAKLLRGKHKPNYAPNLDCGDHVIVVNASRVVMTGKKLTDKQMQRHSGYPGGLHSTSYAKIMVERPELAVEKAVRGMLPRSKLGRQMFTKLKVYPGPQHPHGAQNPTELDLKRVAAPHDPEQAHTIEEVTGA